MKLNEEDTVVSVAKVRESVTKNDGENDSGEDGGENDDEIEEELDSLDEPDDGDDLDLSDGDSV